MIRKALSYIVVAVLLSGCGASYLFSPNPVQTRKTKGYWARQDSQDDQNLTNCYRVAVYTGNPTATPPAAPLALRSEALRCANDARDEYLRAENVYSSVPGILQAALIPIGGAALALGIEGYSGGPVTGLGVGAASLFAIGKGYQNKSREAVYNTGALAIDCLLSNMQPYTMVSAANLEQLGTALTDLSTAKAQLDEEIREYRQSELPSYCSQNTKKRKLIAQLLTAANKTSKAAEDSLKAGEGFQSYTNQSAKTIVHTVYSINEGVTSALRGTEPDVQSLAASMKGVIPSSADNFAGIQTAQSSSAAAKKSNLEAQNAFQNVLMGAAKIPPKAHRKLHRKPTPEGKLSDDIARVEKHISTVNGIIGPATKVPDNKACVALTKQAKAPKVLTLNPRGDIRVAQGSTTKVSIKGVTTKAMVFAEFAQASKLKSMVTATLKGSTLEIAADPATDEGLYPFIVMDGPTGVPFRVVVEKKPQNQHAALLSCPKPKKHKPHRRPVKLPPVQQGGHRPKQSKP